jgi:hypothetical protein
MLTTYPLLVPRVRKSSAIPPLTLWVLLGLLWGSLYLHVYIYIYIYINEGCIFLYIKIYNQTMCKLGTHLNWCENFCFMSMLRKCAQKIMYVIPSMEANLKFLLMAALHSCHTHIIWYCSQNNNKTILKEWALTWKIVKYKLNRKTEGLEKVLCFVFVAS